MKEKAIAGAVLFVLVLSIIGATAAEFYDPNPSNDQATVTVTPYSDNATNSTNTVPMQPTGVPVAGMIVSIIMVGSGLLMSKRRK